MASIKKSADALFQIKGMNKQHRMFNALISIMQDFTDQSSLGKVLTLIADLEAELTKKLGAVHATEAAQKK